MAKKKATKAAKAGGRAAVDRASWSPTGGAPFFRPFEALKKQKKPAKGSAAAEAKPAPKPRPPAPRPEEPRLSASDADTFAIYMSGVAAIEPKAQRIPLSASRIERAAPGALPPVDRDAAARQSLRTLVTDAIRFDVTDDGDALEGRRVDVDPRELRRLRKGQYAVDGKLDLHGMTALEARAAVETFVHRKRTEGDRVVLIVHGKGTHSPRGSAVLRGEIAAWLSQGRGARDVSAFASSEDAGAVLVLLAR